MAEATEDQTEAAEGDNAPKKQGLKGLLLALLPALLLGGGAFFATYTGMATLPFGGAAETSESKKTKPEPKSFDVAYLELDELVVPLSPRARSRFLVFQASIEAAPEDIPALEQIRPRILDVFNTYLRAIEEKELDEPSAMALLRARLLRRLGVVAAPVAPKDLLITTFVLK